MSWGKFLIISLGLMLLIDVADARDIDSFTDSQGVLHITNRGAKKPGSPTNPPAAPVTLPPPGEPGKAQVTLPAREPVSKAKTPDLKPEAPPAKPVPVAPQPAPRITQTAGPGELNQVTVGTGGKGGPGAAAEAPAPPLKPVSYSPPQPARPAPEGAIAVHRDHRGVIHITNVASEVPDPVPLTPAPKVPKLARSRTAVPPPVQRLEWFPETELPAVQKLAWCPEPAPPTVEEASCPELGPEVGEYLRGKLEELAEEPRPNTIHRFQDHRGVWRIVNNPAPDPQPPQAQLAASGEPITLPASAQGAVRPPPGHAV